jgi:hypothetical protein
MVYDGVNNPASGGAHSDTGACSYCCANTYSYSSRVNGYSDADADTYASMRRAGLRRREHSY